MVFVVISSSIVYAEAKRPSSPLDPVLVNDYERIALEVKAEKSFEKAVANFDEVHEKNLGHVRVCLIHYMYPAYPAGVSLIRSCFCLSSSAVHPALAVRKDSKILSPELLLHICDLSEPS